MVAFDLGSTESVNQPFQKRDHYTKTETANILNINSFHI